MGADPSGVMGTIAGPAGVAITASSTRGLAGDAVAAKGDMSLEADVLYSEGERGLDLIPDSNKRTEARTGDMGSVISSDIPRRSGDNGADAGGGLIVLVIES